jgi:succinyl-diaminopimelate desuccinylase
MGNMRKKTLKAVFERLSSSKDDIVRSMVEMCSIPAYHPSSGGDGESEKTRHLEDLVKSLDLECKVYYAPDESVSSGHRPSMMVYPKDFPPKGAKRTWIVSHSDVVPPGELSKWKHPPFEPWVKNGKVYGRGTEDNGQAIIASLYALWALKKEGIGANGGIVIVADEETGSKKGIQYLLSKGLFDKSDLVLIPDWGSNTGDRIEIAEKSLLWMKFTTEGKQVHASIPHTGINAFRASSHLLCKLDEKLHEKFGSMNTLFDPPFSTFEPTKKEANVPNVNTVPGTDVFYIDSRVLPDYSLDDVVAIVNDQKTEIEKEWNVGVNVELVMRERSPATSEESKIVKKLKTALRELRRITAQPVGIGGGTCAAFFRKAGIEVAVWQTCDGMAHAVNEYSKIKNILNDAKVFSHVLSAE